MVRISSVRLVHALARYGVVPAKSESAEAKGGINSGPHAAAFFRGVVDGDGYLGWQKSDCGVLGKYAKVGLVGSRLLVGQFADYVRSVAPVCEASVHPMNGIWAFTTTGSVAVKVIRRLYENCPVALPRKLAVANEILSLCSDDTSNYRNRRGQRERGGPSPSIIQRTPPGSSSG